VRKGGRGGERAEGVLDLGEEAAGKDVEKRCFACGRDDIVGWEWIGRELTACTVSADDDLEGVMGGCDL
jgi:hypothetical protein